MSDSLDQDFCDRVALVTRIAASLVPFVGGSLAELVTEVIPRLRQERIVEYLRELEARLATLEREKVDRILEDPEKVDLIESGGHVAARATTSDRTKKIAEIVFRGLGAEETSRLRRKRLIGLFGEIDDDEFLILNAFGQSYRAASSEAWEMIDRPPPAVLGVCAVGRLLYEMAGLLCSVGLFRRRSTKRMPMVYPAFDLPVAEQSDWYSEHGYGFCGYLCKAAISGCRSRPVRPPRGRTSAECSAQGIPGTILPAPSSGPAHGTDGTRALP